MRGIRMLILVCLGSLVLAGAASGQTVPIPGMPCSATANMSFATIKGTFTQNYGGGTSCAGGVGQKTLDVVPQVFNVVNGKPIWFNISLVGLYQGPTPINPLRLSGSRAAVASHRYRVLVYGQTTLNGKTSSATACAGVCSGSPRLTINQSDINTPFGPTTAAISGTPCSVSEFGPTFALVNGSFIMTYAGHMSCNRSTSGKNLTVGAQVQNGSRFFTITGSTLSTTGGSPFGLSLSTARSAFLGHGYRIFATGTVQGKTARATGRTSAP